MQLMFYAFTASVVSSKMNFSVRPCDDFYQFACGRFETTTIIPEDSGSINTINMIEGRVMSQLHTLLNSEILPGDISPFKMAKQMFRQCMNTSESWRINLLKITLFKSSPITSSNREEWIGFCQAEIECDDEVASFDGGRWMGWVIVERDWISPLQCWFLHRHRSQAHVTSGTLCEIFKFLFPSILLNY